MATKVLSQQQLQAALKKIDLIYSEFEQELALLKAERIKLIDRLNRQSDDKKIQAILKKIK